ncbi:protease SohB [Salinicola rhizosphaerae]|uniref:Protease n=1 Tax=Salinicola rhizosphaerae TaxID=1443141 RepID=A0ABQ3DP79_9GAMM|nr:protease SohB [Salinicola rhizosphaerae]GHB08828.1 protease [Salinicola rhizosphaerae]
MIEWLADYGLFLAKTVTLVIAVVLILAVIAKGRGRAQGGDAGAVLKVTELDARFDRRRRQLQLAAAPKARRRQLAKRLRKVARQADKQAPPAERERVWVVDFDGDLKASKTPALADLVSLLLEELREGDEVVLRLQSGGGLVHSYGLASAQLDRLRDAGASLTVCVDKVAASGGYMMACCANRLIAAPFAVIGSIGVVAQIPNVHRLLKKHDVDVELLTAGRYKRTLTVLGENSEEGRAKFLEDLQSTHDLFKQYVGERRPGLDIENVATGEIWYGSQALAEGLIDAVGTSDAYLLEKQRSHARVLHIALTARSGLLGRLGKGVESGLERGVDQVMQRVDDLRWQRR